MNRRFWLGLAAYAVPTFVLGYTWHLIFFASYYEALQIYRETLIVPFGMLAILIQGAILSWTYGRLFAASTESWLSSGLKFAAVAGLFAWTYSTLAVGAKHPMTSVPDFLVIETAFTAVQHLIAGLLIALAHRRST